MVSSEVQGHGRRHDLVSLFRIFVAWKALLVAIALASPGVGYDTSTSLLGTTAGGLVSPAISDTPTSMQYSPWLKLVRWDALYFTHMADQGHVFEQEWAFGVGLSSVISWIAKGNQPPVTTKP